MSEQSIKLRGDRAVQFEQAKQEIQEELGISLSNADTVERLLYEANRS